MGWVKTPIRTNEDIFNEIIKKKPKWYGTPFENGSPYEYWSDYLRDYYNVTIKQCDEICTMLKEHYKIKKFYATDK